MPITQVGVKFKSEVGADFQMGVACTVASCGKVESLKSILSGNATPVMPTSFQGVKVEASFYAFLFADLEAGTRLASLSKFRIGALESTAGLKLEAKLASEETQVNDITYASNYKLAFEAVIGAGDEFEMFLSLIKITVAKLELKLTKDIAFSPAATATADKTSFREAEVVKFKVKLDPARMDFPIIGYNVETVRIYRKSRQQDGSVVLVLAAQANPSAKQTEFDLTWAATLNGDVKDNFVVFVQTRLLPDLRLEMGDVVGVSLGCTAPAGVKYCITGIGAADDRTDAVDINDAGQVVGLSVTGSAPFKRRAFLWQNGQMKFLTEPTDSTATSINSIGQVVGYSPGVAASAFLWQGGQLSNLGRFFDSVSVINDAGHVLGKEACTPKIYKNGQATVLSGLGCAQPLDMNNQDQVVGEYNPASFNGSSRAFLWSNGQVTNLGTLPGGRQSWAFGINNKGQVVGLSDDANLQTQGFIWQNGTMTQLPSLGPVTVAQDLNEAGQIVGVSSFQAALWQGGTVTDLNTLIDPTLGWDLQGANAINNQGQIVGHGVLGGKLRAFLLTPAQP